MNQWQHLQRVVDHFTTIFIVGGFRNWRKVGGKDCYFQGHIGKYPNSTHRVAKQMCKDLMNQGQHLQRVVDHFTTE